MTTMLETGTYRSVPRKISQLTSFVTSEPDLFVLAHLGIPAISRDDWTLSVTGMVASPLTLRFEDLAGFQDHALTSFHKCAGNPMKPGEPTPDRIGNVVWRGIRLRDVLVRSGYDPQATHVWADGSDGGSFAGVLIAKYQKDIPIEKALRDEVLLAFEINGEPLSAYRGGPVRLIVPGWYGTNSVKWVSALHLAERRAGGPFTTTWYNDTDAAGVRHPVWSVAPDSAIVTPETGAMLDAGRVEITGWSWGEHDIARVDVSIDGGETWSGADLSPRIGKSWQGFTAIRHAAAGALRIVSRATDVEGRTQPMSGARNASVVVEAFSRAGPR
ncbi:MAG: putative oxidoreductase molybdopterin binding [Tardiphaga sp.]|jgi:DMSO/TMAO reductase YedYZ molybdopterin-dependent catalytic subunit|nr:putative oxidoreductase molybdopterin binding [Tardiphaga sp.]